LQQNKKKTAESKMTASQEIHMARYDWQEWRRSFDAASQRVCPFTAEK
jgi:hypothetical protein